MKKTHKVGEDDADIDVTLQGNGSLKIIATCNGETHEHSMTVGATDAPLPDSYGVAQAQQDLDSAIDFAARMAASKARRKQIIGQLA